MTFHLGTPVIVNMGSHGERKDHVDHIDEEGHIYLMNYTETYFVPLPDLGAVAVPAVHCKALSIKKDLTSIYDRR